MAKIQPASKSYFFEDGYIDLLNVIKGAWSNNAATSIKYGSSIKAAWDLDDGFRWFKVVFYIFATISMYVFGTIFCLVLTLVHVSILVIFMVIIYATFMVILTAEELYLVYNKVFTACPKCKEKFFIPTYICPSCQVEHTSLVPGVYGILKRQCECRHKMPTTFFNGRRFLKAKCPMCESVLDTKEAVPICIPVIGGPSVGKTCYISGLMKILMEKICPQSKLTVEFYDQRNMIECRQMIDQYNRGILQMKTTELNPTAYNFFLKGRFLFPDRLIYIYDIAGEAFHTTDALTSQKHYEYCHGVIFIVDPLAIPEVRDRYEESDDYQKHGASVSDINDTFDSFIMNLKRISGLTSTQLSKVPCAVVINKADAYDLDDKLGVSAAADLLGDKEQKFKRLEDALSHLARTFLISNGMYNFVNNIETCFKRRKYFSCSSLGDGPDGSGFSPVRVFAPFRWIISIFDKSLWKRLKEYSGSSAHKPTSEAEANRGDVKVEVSA